MAPNNTVQCLMLVNHCQNEWIIYTVYHVNNLVYSWIYVFQIISNASVLILWFNVCMGYIGRHRGLAVKIKQINLDSQLNKHNAQINVKISCYVKMYSNLKVTYMHREQTLDFQKSMLLVNPQMYHQCCECTVHQSYRISLKYW